MVSYNLAVEEPVFDDDADVLDVLLDAPFNADLCNFSIDNVEKPAEIENVWAWGGANYGAKATAFSSSVNYKSESWLISRFIDLGGHEGAMMSFEQATNFFASVEAAKDEATVWIREEDGEWSQITGYDFRLRCRGASFLLAILTYLISMERKFRLLSNTHPTPKPVHGK